MQVTTGLRVFAKKLMEAQVEALYHQSILYDIYRGIAGYEIQRPQATLYTLTA
jgi:hypothetical protein